MRLTTLLSFACPTYTAVITGISVAFSTQGKLAYLIQLASTLVSLILIVWETVTIVVCVHSLVQAQDSKAKRKSKLIRQGNIEEESDEGEEVSTKQSSWVARSCSYLTSLLTTDPSFPCIIQQITEVIDHVENMALTNWQETKLRPLSKLWMLALMLSLAGLNTAFTLGKVHNCHTLQSLKFAPFFYNAVIKCIYGMQYV